MNNSKIAVVTGSSYGLGLSITKLLLSNDFKVYGISRSKPKIIDKNFVYIKADLLVDKSYEIIKSVVVEERIDLLVNNAGVVFAEKALEFTQTIFDKTFGLNLIVPIRLTSILKRKLKNGIVVNISSTSDRFAEDRIGMYCASKSALDIYFDAVAIENKDIKVLNILPVYIDTPMLKDISEKLKFSTDGATKSEKVAEVSMEIINRSNDFESGSRIMILSDKTLDEATNPEKLWYYNIDTREFKKVN